MSPRARRVLVRVHLWTALAIGLYLIVVCVSGSIAIFRPNANLWLVPYRVPSVEGERLTGDALDAAVRLVYADSAVLSISEPRGRRAGVEPAARPVNVALERDGVRSGRVFDPYAARDLGDTFPPLLRAMEWTVDLHANLQLGITGKRINGIGGALLLVMLATGALIWWQGRTRFWRGMIVTRAPPRPLIWQLHGAVGFWSFALLFIWAITAVYFAFPTYFEDLIDFFDDDPNDFDRPGEALLLQLVALHFGRFSAIELRFVWAVMGLMPVVLFVTGFTLWWRGVVRRRLAAPEPAVTARDAGSPR
jgi:uncharacterized iron-regulated membrane protein